MLRFRIIEEKINNIVPLIHDEYIELFKLLCGISPYNPIFNPDILFKYSCKNGYAKFAKWVLDTFDNVDIHTDTEYPFFYSCVYGHLDIAKWIYELCDRKILFTENIKYIFCRTCEAGYLHVAKWLYSTFDIDPGCLDNYSFRWSCNNGNFDVVYWLFNLGIVDKTFIEDNDCFKHACINGYTDIIEWLYSICDISDISDNNYDIFTKVCINDHIDIAKWLYSLDPNNIYKKINWNDLFTLICKNAGIEMIKWILNINPNINITYYGNRSFIYACQNGNYDVIKFLYDHMTSTLGVTDAYLNTCSNDYNFIAKWLWDRFEELHTVENVEYTIMYACENGNLELAKWATSLNISYDIHKYDEYCFREVCERGYFDILLLLWDLDMMYDIRIRDDYAFRRACKNNFIEIAEFLVHNCSSYSITVYKDKITSFSMTNDIQDALRMLQNDYIGALSHLNIKIIWEKKVSMCIICQEDNDAVITNCNHTYCLECLLKWFTIIEKSNNFKCAYCRKSFSLGDLVAFYKKN